VEVDLELEEYDHLYISLSFGFLFNKADYSGLDRVHLGLAKKNHWKLLMLYFYRLDALSVTQPTVSRH